MEQDSGNKGLVVVIIVIVVLVGGYLLLSGSSGTGSGTGSGIGGSGGKSAVTALPPLTQDELLGKKSVPAASLDAVAAHKAEILKRVRNGKPLTQEEKGAIGNVMLTEAHIYKFTDEERDTIFAALQK